MATGVQKRAKTTTTFCPSPKQWESILGYESLQRLIIHLHDKDFQFSETGIFIYFVLINYPEMKSLSKLSLIPKIFTTF